MANNWIILNDGTPEGVPINLDFVLKVLYGGNFKAANADQKKTVFVYHGIPTNATYGQAIQAILYGSETEAKAQYRRILSALSANNDIRDDCRQSLMQITSISPTSAVAGVNTTITVNGSGFPGGGTLTVLDSTEVALTITPISDTQFSFQTGTGFASSGGTYRDILLTTPDGKLAKLIAALKFT